MCCVGFWGGSADLAPSNMTLMKQFGDFQKDTPQERNLRYGVREHGMGAIANGITLHSPGFITYCATFFIFTGKSLDQHIYLCIYNAQRFTKQHLQRRGLLCS